MIQTTPFSQRDPRWKNIKLGFSNLTIGGYGCTITSLAMLLNTCGHKETPKTVNEKLKARKGFVGALLVWGAVEKEWNVKFVKRSQTYNNIEVAWYVYAKKMPVIVKVYAPQIGAISHWVLYVGDRYMIDPWTGKGLPTKTYKPIGYALYDKR